MSIIAEFSIKSDDFALNHALTAAPQMIVEIEQVVATMENRVMPYFWVTGGDHDDFESAFQADASVTNTAVIDEVEEARLYRAEWTENVETIVYAYLELGATLLQAIGKASDWELRMRFDSHDSLSEFQDYCNGNDISFELNRTQEQEQPMASAQYDLTPTQRETLVAALEAGYYDVPRAVTMRELAEQMGIAQQTLSNRFRAAYKNLVTSTLTLSHPDENED
ncbi:helix-turn-helix domain-containing protein [Natronolimnohabitans innermongolicus]|uniref:Bacterio-opsin activator HTH domain-containing protein n=1 Tax=Natronolimnohabitans innermongolicus JCM 12255 TaxID=1227499 RepID=L9X7W0_9EURY|nr:helix-turn-helix domain-containing protein [Natronolimnohabitans innermongolicus]ELY57692.1 bacterio-opsin activator HTH domain-containing protein [Natronolimnohabitans innermongolicus JCM 12255]